jgi:hypothetical protein
VIVFKHELFSTRNENCNFRFPSVRKRTIFFISFATSKTPITSAIAAANGPHRTKSIFSQLPKFSFFFFFLSFSRGKNCHHLGSFFSSMKSSDKLIVLSALEDSISNLCYHKHLNERPNREHFCNKPKSYK